MALELMHTGVFATPEEVKHVNSRVHHATVAVASFMRRDETPAGRCRRLCQAYGLPARDDGALYAVCIESGELVYAWPEGRPQ